LFGGGGNICQKKKKGTQPGGGDRLESTGGWEENLGKQAGWTGGVARVKSVNVKGTRRTQGRWNRSQPFRVSTEKEEITQEIPKMDKRKTQSKERTRPDDSQQEKR